MGDLPETRTPPRANTRSLVAAVNRDGARRPRARSAARSEVPKELRELFEDVPPMPTLRERMENWGSD